MARSGKTPEPVPFEHCPHKLREMLDPIGGQEPQPELKNKTTHEAQYNIAHKEFKAFAEALFAKSSLKKHHTDEELQFMLGFDKLEPTRRLCAIICRAYWRALEFKASTELQNETPICDLSKANDILKNIQTIYKGLYGNSKTISYDEHNGGNYHGYKGTFVEAFTLLEQHPQYSRNHNLHLWDNLCTGIRALNEVHRQLYEMVDWKVIDHAPERADYLFFIARLGEIFTLITGKLPNSNSHYKKKAPEFNIFMLYALKLTKVGEKGLDNALRKISGNEKEMPKREWFEPEHPCIKLSKKMVCLKDRVNGTINDRIEFYDLPTVDTLIHYSLLPEPNSYVRSTPPPEMRLVAKFVTS